jgi:hypothetical protein
MAFLNVSCFLNLFFVSGELELDVEEEERRQNDAITVWQFLCAKLDEGVK